MVRVERGTGATSLWSSLGTTSQHTRLEAVLPLSLRLLPTKFLG